MDKIILILISFLFLLPWACDFADPEQIKKSSINLNIHDDIAVLEINTSHEINDQIKVNCRFDLNSGAKVLQKIYGRIEYKTGDLMGVEPKRSYSMILFKKEALTGETKKSEWLLRALYFDKTFSRDLLANYLFEQLVPDFKKPAMEFVNLYLNGVFKGLYLLSEKVDETNFSWIKKEGMLFKEPTIFVKEYDLFNQIYPVENIINYSIRLHELKTFLFESNKEEFCHPEKGVFSYFDIENLINWNLILLLSNNAEGLYKDFYLSASSINDPFMITIRDYDNSLGRNWKGQILDTEIDLNQQILFRKLMQYNPDQYLEKLKLSWNHLITTHNLSADAAISFIDSVNLLIQQSVIKNFEVFPADGPLYTNDNNYEQEVYLLKERVRFRFYQMDSLLLNLHPSFN